MCEEEGGFWFCEGLFCVLVEEEVALFCVLEDHVDVVVFGEGVPEGDGVWVVDGGVEAYLSFDEFEFNFGGDGGEVDLGVGGVTILTA